MLRHDGSSEDVHEPQGRGLCLHDSASSHNLSNLSNCARLFSGDISFNWFFARRSLHRSGPDPPSADVSDTRNSIRRPTPSDTTNVLHRRCEAYDPMNEKPYLGSPRASTTPCLAVSPWDTKKYTAQHVSDRFQFKASITSIPPGLTSRLSGYFRF